MSIVDQILSLNIEDVISKYGVELKRKGQNFSACCPLHNEKTPSFIVSPQKNIFKCFGCGKGGNAINFVREYKNLDFWDACNEIASDFGIDIPEWTPEQKQDHEKNRSRIASLYSSVEWLADYYKKALVKDTDPYKYVINRFNPEYAEIFYIGYAPKGFEVVEAAKIAGHFDNLLKLQYFRSSLKNKNVIYPVFQNRIIFPVWDKSSRIVGFSARAIAEADQPKYLNSFESEIYKKSFSLYGLNFAYKAIIEKKSCYLVEGNPDVIRLHSINKYNCVSASGTALAHDAILELKKITKHVTLIGDYDPPSKSKDNSGEKAMLRNAIKLIEYGFIVNVVFLVPDNPTQKADPDNFFNSEADFDEYIAEHTRDYFVWKAEQYSIKGNNNINFQSEIIEELCPLLLNYNPSIRESYVEKLGKIIKPRKIWSEKLKEIAPQKSDETYYTSKQIPKDISLADVDRFGFYESKNQYFFQTNKEGWGPKTNFVLRPIMFIPSSVNAKRIFEIINTNNHKSIIELSQKDLISIPAFRLRIESIGNYVFEGNEFDMNKLKRYLYEVTDQCTEILQLGWQKQGFWAWGNGIYIPDEKLFVEINDYGIVECKERKYYLPAFSKIFEKDDDLFQTERRFVFKEGKISLYDFCNKFHVVFGDNAIIAFAFLFATLFRDVFFKTFKNFPILNFFGPKGTGKSDMAVMLLQFFGSHPKGLNMASSTKPAMAAQLGISSNMLSHFDEYRNSLEIDKVEVLKSVYDGTGRTRMNMERDKKQEVTRVDCGVLLCGQEMPTLDIALFSRVIFTTFHKGNFSVEEKKLFQEVQDISLQGLSHLTHQLLNHRSNFAKKWHSYFDEAYDMLKDNSEAHIEERIIKNYSVLLSAFNFFADNVELPFNKSMGLEILKKTMIVQNRETKSGSEVSIFWSIFESNVLDGLVSENIDFKIELVNLLKTDIVDAQYSEAKTVLFLRFNKVATHYRKTGLSMKEPILPSKTIEYYLKNSPSFLGLKRGVAFHVQHHGDTPDIEGRQVRNVTSAYCFDYSMLSIDIIKLKSKEFNTAASEFEYSENGNDINISVPDPVFANTDF